MSHKRYRLVGPDGREHTEQAWRAHEEARRAGLREQFGKLYGDDRA